MNSADLSLLFTRFSTPLVCDASLRLGIAHKIPDAGLRPLRAGMRIAGRVLPVRHYGSVDVFLEAFERGEPGDVLVIDNEGRLDEGCVGDLTVLEARGAGLGGILVWGAHRDTAELLAIDFPVFSYATCPSGPTLRPRPEDSLVSAPFGRFRVDAGWFVAADDDGVVFAPLQDAGRIFTTAETIWAKERAQAEGIRAGSSLRDQLRFSEYLEARQKDPSYSFRHHLKRIGGAIEE